MGQTAIQFTCCLLACSFAGARVPGSLPFRSDKTIIRTSVLWGLGGSATTDGADRHTVHLLPFGLLLCRSTSPGQSSIQIGQNDHPHECSVGIRRECHDGWGRPPYSSPAAFWPAPLPEHESRAVFHSDRTKRSSARVFCGD